MILSIVIPVYNVERYIGRCLASCVQQDIPMSDYEIIVVNDGHYIFLQSMFPMVNRHYVLIIPRLTFPYGKEKMYFLVSNSNTRLSLQYINGSSYYRTN